MQWFTVGCVAIASAGLVAYDYFTEPQRVFGANELDCPPYEIEWQPDTGGLTKITGCGKSIRVKCDQTQCATPDP